MKADGIEDAILELIYDEQTFGQILFVTGILGGGAAFLTGRALALTWRPLPHLVAYVLLLAAAVRFIHFAIFDAFLLSIPAYLADAAFLVILGTLGFRITRTFQMVRQYPWLYERTGLFTWRDRTG